MPFAPPKIADEVIKALSFNDRGLIPAIAQQYDSGEVLMMAWMSAESIRKTLDDGIVCYYSRSRDALWQKGETSGHVQTLKDFRYDCDNDTILVLVDQAGVACHTGRRTCFFNKVTGDGVDADAATALPAAHSH